MWTMTVTARFNIFGVPGSGPDAGLGVTLIAAFVFAIKTGL